MSADFYCWAASAGMTPSDPNFDEWVDAKTESTEEKAAPSLEAFADALLKRYPDISPQGGATIWTFSPIKSTISDDFMSLHVTWDGLQDALAFIVETAHRHDIDCYDPQTGDYYPAPVRSSPSLISRLIKGLSGRSN